MAENKNDETTRLQLRAWIRQSPPITMRPEYLRTFEMPMMKRRDEDMRRSINGSRK